MGNEQSGAEEPQNLSERAISKEQLSLFNGSKKYSYYIGFNGIIFEINDEEERIKLKLKLGKNHLITEEEFKIIEKDIKYSKIGKLVELQSYTVEELSIYTGHKTAENPEGKILISAKGFIFDVSSGSGFYGPDCGYNIFAGKNAQRALAKTSLKAEDIVNTSIDDLSVEEKKTLDEWIAKYMQKYSHVGTLV